MNRRLQYLSLTTLYAAFSRRPQQPAPVHVGLRGLDPPEVNIPDAARGTPAGTSADTLKCHTRTIPANYYAKVMMVFVSEPFFNSVLK